MKIRMLISISGHADGRYGLDSFAFAPGEVVDVHKTLATAWIASGSAEKVKGKLAEPEPEPEPEPTTTEPESPTEDEPVVDAAADVDEVKAEDSATVQEGA